MLRRAPSVPNDLDVPQIVLHRQDSGFIKMAKEPPVLSSNMRMKQILYIFVAAVVILAILHLTPFTPDLSLAISRPRPMR